MDNVDPQDVRMVDEAIARLNVARLRVDNATRRLKTLLGIPLQEHRPQEQVITERISATLKMPSSEDGAQAVC
jgi:outer membrane protein TolC